MTARRAAAIAALLLWLGTLGAARAATTAKGLAVFPILARSDVSAPRWGYGFLVEDWRPGSDGYLLVTAAHVVYRATSVSVFKLPEEHFPASVSAVVDASGVMHPRPNPDLIATLDAGEDALFWPTLELAAFPIARWNPIARGAVQLGLAIAAADTSPEPKGDIFVFAYTDYLQDTHFPIKTSGGDQFITARVHGESIAARTARDVAMVLGSMRDAPETPLIAYSIPSMAGMSGAPVSAYVNGVPKIIAVHLAGLASDGNEILEHATVGTAWAVCLAPATRSDPVALKLGGDGWPDTYSTPQFRQGDERYYDEALRKKVLDDTRYRIFVGAVVGRAASGHGTDERLVGLHGGIDKIDWVTISHAFALKVDISLLYREGSYAFPSEHRDSRGAAYNARFALCIPSSMCTNHVTLAAVVEPLSIGYLHAAATRAEPSTVDAMTLRHGLGARVDAMLGPVRVFVEGNAAVEKALGATAYTHIYSVDAGLEVRVKNWNPWLR